MADKFHFSSKWQSLQKIAEEKKMCQGVPVQRHATQDKLDFVTPPPLLVLGLIPRPVGDPSGEGEGHHDSPLLLQIEFNAKISTLQCICVYVGFFFFLFFTGQELNGNQQETQRLQRIITNLDSRSVPILCINPIRHG